MSEDMLPRNWTRAPLGDLILFAIGGDWGKDESFDDPDYTDARCIRASELREWEKCKGNTAALRRVKKSSLASRELMEGDILVEISGGGPEQPVGRTVLIEKSVLHQNPETAKICTNFFRMLRPVSAINSTYLNWYLKYFYQTGRIVKYQAGSNNLRNLKFNDYLTIAIPAPPYTEQHRIVSKIETLFSELDKGIESLKTTREQLKVYRQAVLKHAFEGKLTARWREENMDKLEAPEQILERIKKEREVCYQQQLTSWKAATKAWETKEKDGKKPVKPKRQIDVTNPTEEELCGFAELPTDWKWVKLGELVWSVKDGPHFSPKYADSGIPFITGGNVRPGGIDFSSAKFITPELHCELSARCKPEKGDVLYTKGGTTGIARANTYDLDFNVWVHVAVLKITDSISPFYLQHALNSPKCYAQSQKFTHGVGNQDLGLTRMINIILPVCSKAEQEKIIQLLDQLTSEFDEIEKIIELELAKSETLRQSILKKAFSGQLVPQDPNDEPTSILLERIQAEKTKQPPRKRSASKRKAGAE